MGILPAGPDPNGKLRPYHIHVHQNTLPNTAQNEKGNQYFSMLFSFSIEVVIIMLLFLKHRGIN